MHNNIAVGAGLISLDVLIWVGKLIPVGYYVGGTCGNVMMSLAHMGWESYPIARLDETKDAQRIRGTGTSIHAFMCLKNVCK